MKEQTVNTTTETEAIKQTIKEWIRFLDKDDIEGTVSFWTDDAIILAPAQPTVKGKEAIRQMVTFSRSIPGFKVVWEDPSEVVVAQSSDMAYVITKNHVTMNDPSGNPVTQSNKALSVWKKQADGSWKCAVDTWTPEP